MCLRNNFYYLTDSIVDILDIIQIALILAVSIGLHEYAHAYVSHIFGDPTPKLQGRLTPNPLKHLDPIWFLLIFLVHFGRGKPVQINPSYYKNPRRDELMVALAGPATNLVLALVAVLILVLYSLAVGYNLTVLFGQSDMFVSFRFLFASINISLAVFNMLPLPPLDGFRLVKMFFWKQAKLIEQYNLYISLAFLFIIMGPGSNFFGLIIGWVSEWILRLFFAIFGQVLY